MDLLQEIRSIRSRVKSLKRQEENRDDLSALSSKESKNSSPSPQKKEKTIKYEFLSSREPKINISIKEVLSATRGAPPKLAEQAFAQIISPSSYFDTKDKKEFKNEFDEFSRVWRSRQPTPQSQNTYNTNKVLKKIPRARSELETNPKFRQIEEELESIRSTYNKVRKLTEKRKEAEEEPSSQKKNSASPSPEPNKNDQKNLQPLPTPKNNFSVSFRKEASYEIGEGEECGDLSEAGDEEEEANEEEDIYRQMEEAEEEEEEDQAEESNLLEKELFGPQIREKPARVLTNSFQRALLISSEEENQHASSPELQKRLARERQEKERLKKENILLKSLIRKRKEKKVENRFRAIKGFSKRCKEAYTRELRERVTSGVRRAIKEKLTKKIY